LGFILIVLGILGLVWGGFQKFKAGRLAKTPFAKTGDVASKGEQVADPKGAVSVEGQLKAGGLVKSPATGTECLYYELKVVGTWKDGDSTKSKDYIDEKVAAEFSVDDGSGAIGINASEGGDFEPMETTFDETKKEGLLADLKSAVGKGEPMMFGSYAFENPPMSKANKFTCTEKVFKPQDKLFVLGRLDAGKIGAPKWASLIISNKGREELLGATATAAKRFLIGGGAALGVGIIFAIIGAVMGGDEVDTAAVDEGSEPTGAIERVEPAPVELAELLMK